MTNKELIGILQALPSDGTPCFSLGMCGNLGNEYRRLCAMAELINGDCLDFLEIDRVEIIDDLDGSGIWADIHLAQNNLSDLESFEKKFDEQYKKV
jgi:hypothetical protein